MPERQWWFYLADMHDATQSAIRFTEAIEFPQFCQQDEVISAVSFKLIILGEAANQIPEEYKQQHPEIPWIGIRGLRNRIAHDYLNLDVETIWTIVKDELPKLRNHLFIALDMYRKKA